MVPEKKSVTGRQDAAENHAVSIPHKIQMHKPSSCTRPNFGTALAVVRQALKFLPIYRKK